MPIVKPPLGKELDLLLRASAAYGVPSEEDYVRTPVYALNLRATRPLESDPILAGGFANGRDATAPAPALTSHAGSVSAPMDLRHIGWWLALAFGAPDTTEDDGVFTHVFESGADALPSWTMEAGLDGAFRQHIGVVARTMRFALGQEAGYRRVEIELAGRDEVPLEATAAGTPPAMLVRAPIAAARGILKRGGTPIANLLSFEGTYDNGLEEERLVDESDLVSGWLPSAESAMSGQMTLRYLDDTYDVLGAEMTAQAIELAYALSATLSLTLAMPAVTFERAGVGIDGPGRLQQQVGFRAAQTAGAPMLTLTLVNDVADYDAALVGEEA